MYNNTATSNEIWKDIVGFEELYKVSNLGRIKNCKRGNILRGGANQDGYLQTSLRKNGKSFRITIHREVATAFLGKKPENLVTDHIDGDVQNNKVSNLQYVTTRANLLKGKRCVNNKAIGVSLIKKPWRANISINSKNISLGQFRTKKEAARAYDKMWAKIG